MFVRRFFLLKFLLFSALVAASPSNAFDGLPDAKAEEAGFSSARLKRIDDWMNRYVSEGKLVGMTVAVMHRGKVVYVGQAGQADREKGAAIKPDTLYRLYSMSKPITSAAAMMLWEEGKFLLDDPLSKYLPEFKDVKVYAGSDKNGKPILVDAKRPITVRDLFTHTAGFTTGLFTDTPVDKLYRASGIFSPNQTLSDFTPKLAKLPLLNQPGEVFYYSIGIEVLGRLVEVVSGQPLDAFLDQRFFGPLGMKDTSFYLEHGQEGRLAQTYDYDPATGRASASIPKLGIEEAISFSREKTTFLAGGGGLLSTVSDYLRFCQMLLNGGELNGVRVLGSKTVELMMLDHIPSIEGPSPGGIPGYGFGLGGAVLRDVAQSQVPGSVGEFNWAGHASTIFWIDRKENISVVLMTQLVPSGAYPLRKELRALVYQALIN